MVAKARRPPPPGCVSLVERISLALMERLRIHREAAFDTEFASAARALACLQRGPAGLPITRRYSSPLATATVANAITASRMFQT